jgi:hypothetical protein
VEHGVHRCPSLWRYIVRGSAVYLTCISFHLYILPLNFSSLVAMPPMNTHMIDGNRTRGGLHDTKPQPHGTPVISSTGVLHTSSLSVPNGNGSVPYGIQHILNIGKSRPASLPPSFSHDESWSMSPQQSGPASSIRSWPPATGTPRERSERSHSIDSPIAAGFSYSITRWLAEGIEESREIPAMCHDRQERCNHAVTQNLENISASKKQESYRNEDTSFAGGWADDL